MYRTYVTKTDFELLERPLRERVEVELVEHYEHERVALETRKRALEQTLISLKSADPLDEERVISTQIKLDGIYFDLKEIELNSYAINSISDYEFSVLKKETQKAINIAMDNKPDIEQSESGLRRMMMLSIQDILQYVEDSEEAKDTIQRFHYIRREWLKSI